MSSPGSEIYRGNVSGGEVSLLTLARFSLGTAAALGATAALGAVTEDLGLGTFATGGLGLGALALALRGVRGGDLPRLGEADSDRSTFCQS